MRVLLLFCIVSLAIAGEKKKKLKPSKPNDDIARQALKSLTFTREEQIYNIADEITVNTGGGHEIFEGSDFFHPCLNYPCGVGETCVVTDNNEPSCSCAPYCIQDDDVNNRVCSTLNVTYVNECELYRLKCTLPERMADEDLHYYGPCKVLSSCPVSELKGFPVRLRKWFTEVMFSLADLDERFGGLSDEDRLIVEQAMQDDNEYVKPVMWKFRSLDRQTKDGYLSSQELNPLKAALIPLEHCASVFFAQCDSDRDKFLNRQEWGLCLGLTEDEIRETI